MCQHFCRIVPCSTQPAGGVSIDIQYRRCQTPWVNARVESAPPGLPPAPPRPATQFGSKVSRGTNAGCTSGVAGVDARRATPPDPRLPRRGLAGCRQLDPSHPALVTCEDAKVEPCRENYVGTAAYQPHSSGSSCRSRRGFRPLGGGTRARCGRFGECQASRRPRPAAGLWRPELT